MNTPRIAIVGAGPAGIFTAAHLLAKCPEAHIDMLDRSHTPYGLVRYGVAPDHHKIKSVTKVLARTLASPNVQFLGHVSIGSPGTADLTVNELSRHYHAIVIATGARRSKHLGVPGADLTGSHTAAEVVLWYNAHPGAAAPITAPWHSVAVVGGGNVALDVARILLTDPSDLATTDVPRATLARLRGLEVDEVHLIVRGLPSAARFDQAELRRLEALDGLDLILSDATGELAGEAPATGPAALLRTWSSRPPADHAKRLHLHFGVQIARIRGSQTVEAVDLTPTEGRYRTIPPSLPVRAVVAAIGFRGEAIPGLPFDAATGIIPNEQGRVWPGAYVAGWIKHGPRGVIGTNKADAAETARAILADLDRLSLEPRDGVQALLEGRGANITTWEDWESIDAAEIARGATVGASRVKLDDQELQDLLDRLHHAEDPAA